MLMVRTAIAAARRTTMSYTLAEAAAACGLDKSTVRRAVRSGRISGTRDDLGVWHVEPVELHRVFPPAMRTESDTPELPRDAVSESSTATTDTLVALLHQTIDDLRADRDRDRAEHNNAMADLRQERDHWRQAFERAQRALPMPDTIAMPGPATSVPRISGQQSRLRRAWRWMQARG